MSEESSCRLLRSIILLIWLMVLDLGHSQQISCLVLNELVVNLVRIPLHDHTHELASVLSSDIDKVIQIDVMESA